MTTTYGQLVDKVRYLLRSYTGQHEISTHLTADMTAEGLTATISDGNNVSTGLVEIGDELVWVDSSTGGVLTIPPYGRGYNSTTPVAHLTGVQVLTDPFFPRKAIADALVDTQRALYPTLFAVKTTEFLFTAGQTSYNLASDTDRVLSVSWQMPGGSGFWQPLRRWRFDNDANTTSFTSGGSLSVFDAVSPDRNVRVVYAGPFTELSSAAGTIETAGHESSHADLLTYGAAFRLVQFLEVSRLNISSTENQERSKFAAGGAASALTRQLIGLYDRRLEEERRRLLELHRMSIRYTR